MIRISGPDAHAAASAILGSLPAAHRSALRSLVLEHLEDYAVKLKGPSDRRPRPWKSSEDAFRRFLECGVLRFGAVRYRCQDCREDLFVAFSCKRRGLCPS